jgi:hypothetical protein
LQLHLIIFLKGLVLETQDVFHKALVVGTVRNAEDNIVRDLQKIMNALEELVPTLSFVIESDSSDSTLSKLAEHSIIDPRIAFKSLGQLEPTIPDRIERLKYCRNEYVKAIRSNPVYQDCDLIVVADLDGINTKVSTRSFKSALETELEWDILTANQSARYYDILALRHPFWSPNSWTHESDWLTTFMNPEKARRHSLSDRMIRIPKDSSPIQVDSAFGGLGLYRRWVFDEFDYSKDLPEADLEIDHVTLNRKAKSAGAKIYIHPALINSHWTGHSRNGIPMVFKLRKVLNKLNYFGLRKFKRKYFKSFI